MSMTISCTWAGQSTDQTTLDITLERLHECCLRLSRGMCEVAETPGMWEAFDCSSGTLHTRHSQRRWVGQVRSLTSCL